MMNLAVNSNLTFHPPLKPSPTYETGDYFDPIDSLDQKLHLRTCKADHNFYNFDTPEIYRSNLDYARSLLVKTYPIEQTFLTGWPVIYNFNMSETCSDCYKPKKSLSKSGTTAGQVKFRNPIIFNNCYDRSINILALICFLYSLLSTINFISFLTLFVISFFHENVEGFLAQCDIKTTAKDRLKIKTLTKKFENENFSRKNMAIADFLSGGLFFISSLKNVHEWWMRDDNLVQSDYYWFYFSFSMYKKISFNVGWLIYLGLFASNFIIMMELFSEEVKVECRNRSKLLRKASRTSTTSSQESSQQNKVNLSLTQYLHGKGHYKSVAWIKWLSRSAIIKSLMIWLTSLVMVLILGLVYGFSLHRSTQFYLPGFYLSWGSLVVLVCFFVVPSLMNVVLTSSMTHDVKDQSSMSLRVISFINLFSNFFLFINFLDTFIISLKRQKFKSWMLNNYKTKFFDYQIKNSFNINAIEEATGNIIFDDKFYSRENLFSKNFRDLIYQLFFSLQFCWKFVIYLRCSKIFYGSCDSFIDKFDSLKWFLNLAVDSKQTEAKLKRIGSQNSVVRDRNRKLSATRSIEGGSVRSRSRGSKISNQNSFSRNSRHSRHSQTREEEDSKKVVLGQVFIPNPNNRPGKSFTNEGLGKTGMPKFRLKTYSLRSNVNESNSKINLANSKLSIKSKTSMQRSRQNSISVSSRNTSVFQTTVYEPSIIGSDYNYNSLERQVKLSSVSTTQNPNHSNHILLSPRRTLPTHNRLKVKIKPKRASENSNNLNRPVVLRVPRQFPERKISDRKENM